MRFLIHWVVRTLAVIISAYLLPGVKVEGFLSALVTALVVGLLNTVVRPILIFLTLPLTLLTLGLFTLVINALIILLTSAIVPGFEVSHFGWALLFGLVLSVTNALLRAITAGW